MYICFFLVFTQDLKKTHAFFPNYSMICTRLPPLPQLAPTVCFDSLSFCRSAYITSSPIQWSALVFHWQEISMVCFSLQLLTHFPHWYSVMGRGMMEGFSLGVGMCTSVRVSTCREGRPLQLLKMDKKPTHTAGSQSLGEKGITKMKWQSYVLHHNLSDCSSNLGGKIGIKRTFQIQFSV